MLVCKESELQFQVKNIETSWVIDCDPDTFVDTDKDSEDTLEEMFEKIPDYKFHQWKGTNANSLNKNRIHSNHER